MNVTHAEALCMCCNDKTRCERKISEVESKIHLTNNILYCQSIDDKEYEEFKRQFHHRLFILQNDSSHPHFMCGSCRKVNEHELRQKEDQLRDNLYKVFFLVYKTGDETVYHNTLRILQSDYSITYKCLERLWYCRKKEVSKNE